MLLDMSPDDEEMESGESVYERVFEIRFLQILEKFYKQTARGTFAQNSAHDYVIDFEKRLSEER